MLLSHDNVQYCRLRLVTYISLSCLFLLRFELTVWKKKRRRVHIPEVELEPTISSLGGRRLIH